MGACCSGGAVVCLLPRPCPLCHCTPQGWAHCWLQAAGKSKFLEKPDPALSILGSAPHIYNALAEGRSRFSGEGSSLFKLERNLFLFSLLLLKQN